MSEEVLHAGHRSIRLQGHDYSSPGFYFATICVQNKRCIFDKVVGAQVDLNKLGQIVRECWVAIPSHYPQTNLHEFVVIPNHLHGILGVVRQAWGQQAALLHATVAKAREGHGSLGATVRSFKAAVSKRAREELHWSDDVWQRNDFERVLRVAKRLPMPADTLPRIHSSGNRIKKTRKCTKFKRACQLGRSMLRPYQEAPDTKWN